MDSDPAHPHYRQRRLPRFDYASTDYPYVVTIRAKAGTTPFTDPRLCREVISSLDRLRRHRRVTVYAYCLMPGNLHVLLQLGGTEQSLGTILGAFKRYTTRKSWPVGTTGALWQPRFYDHIVRRSEDAEKIITYILAKPERKGLVHDGVTYPWSCEGQQPPGGYRGTAGAGPYGDRGRRATSFARSLPRCGPILYRSGMTST